MAKRAALLLAVPLALAACQGSPSGGSSAASSAGASTGATSAGSTGASSSGATSGGSTSGGSTGSSGSTSGSSGGSSGSTGAAVDPLPASITVAAGFAGATVAHVAHARGLAALPNGDLLVGTTQSSVYLVPAAEADGAAGAPAVFLTLPESPAHGVAYAAGFVYLATEHGVWRVPYHDGDTSEPSSALVKTASVRTGAIAPNSDGDVHHTTSVAATATRVFVSVGSSCNACVEVDPTRATIQQMDPDGQNMTTLATRIRNAVALAIDPATGTLWAGGAGQDNLPVGHPYEFMDPVTTHGPGADYGWPACEEDHHAYQSGANCAAVVAPALEFPAYASNLGAAFYPASPAGPFAFPASYRGGLFVAHHGSWHANPSTPPSVSFVPMAAGAPATPVNWADPTAQFSTFLGGMGTTSSTTYSARPTGVAVGARGSLFVADDQNGAVYRIRPSL